MTDKVSVERDALVDQINALVAIPDSSMSKPIPFLARALLTKASAALAAAPKAEPVKDWDAIRSHPCYGEHQAGCDCSAPEAPKVEQEPGAGAKLAKAFWGVDLVPSLPAPASDELIEALEAEIDRLRPHYQGRGIDQARVQLLDHFADIIANHKGPQS